MCTAIITITERPEAFLTGCVEEVESICLPVHRQFLQLFPIRSAHRPAPGKVEPGHILTLKSTPIVAVELSESNWSSQ